MTGKLKLDNVDRQILTDLQSDGRMTMWIRPSAPAFPHRPACAACVFWKRAGSSAVITRILTRILGYSVQVFAFVGLTSQAETDLQDFEEMVSAWPQVREYTC